MFGYIIIFIYKQFLLKWDIYYIQQNRNYSNIKMDEILITHIENAVIRNDVDLFQNAVQEISKQTKTT